VKNTSTEDLWLVSCDDCSSDSTWFDIGIVPTGGVRPAANSDIPARSQVGGLKRVARLQLSQEVLTKSQTSQRSDPVIAEPQASLEVNLIWATKEVASISYTNCDSRHRALRNLVYIHKLYLRIPIGELYISNLPSLRSDLIVRGTRGKKDSRTW
jgi:hypothetical protein